MNKPLQLALSAVLTGSITSVVSTAALAALAKAEGKKRRATYQLHEPLT
jgi:hypothetical protein